MVTYLPRSAWGARAARGSTALVPSEVLNVAFHWPGMSVRIDAAGDIGARRVASALRGWQNYHMDDRGWSDIAYQIAIDQAGRAWTLRGINIRSGANGDATVNRKYGAVLLVLGPGEQPSAAMVATARAVVADYRKRFAKMPVKPTTHSAVRPAGTDCPGSAARAMILDGRFNAATTSTAGGSIVTDIRDTESYRANAQYGVDFWIAPTGTGKALIDLVKKISLQCDRIEDDTDDGLALKADVAAARDLLDRNIQKMAAQADGR